MAEKFNDAFHGNIQTTRAHKIRMTSRRPKSEKNSKAKRKLEFESMALPNKKPRVLPNQVIVISDDEEHNYGAEQPPMIHGYPIVISDAETDPESEGTSVTRQDDNLAGLDEVILISDDETNEAHDVIIIIDDE